MNGEDLTNKVRLNLSRREEQIFVVVDPVKQPALLDLGFQFTEDFTRGDNILIAHKLFESLPKRQKSLRVVVAEHPKAVGVKNEWHMVCWSLQGKRFEAAQALDSDIQVIRQLLSCAQTVVVSAEREL